jgi:hypothetical protein
MELVKIKDHPSLMRDISSNAVLNTNKQELDEFNKKRQKIIGEKREREETKLRLAQIEQDMMEIKQLLKYIAQLRSANGN